MAVHDDIDAMPPGRGVRVVWTASEMASSEHLLPRAKEVRLASSLNTLRAVRPSGLDEMDCQVDEQLLLRS